MEETALPPIATAIDLERYPIAPREAAPAEALARRCRAQLAATGACLLPGFLRLQLAPYGQAEPKPPQR